MSNKKRSNWHRADIVAELKKKGVSLAAIGRRHGLSSGTVKNALDKPYPRGEQLIAKALDVDVSIIWPERYQ